MLVVMAAVYTGLIFLVLDALWLGVIAKGFIQKEMGALLRPKFLLAPAIGFYLLYTAAMVWFAVLPGWEVGDWQAAALTGGILGLAAYGTYDLTNLATLKGFPVRLVFVDMAWGTFVSAASAGGAVLLLGLYPGA